MSSRLNQTIFHLPDGPEQRARDDAMREAMAAELEGTPMPDGNPNQWADRSKNRIQFDYDAYAEVEKWWVGGGRERIEALAGNVVSVVAVTPSQDLVNRRLWTTPFHPPSPLVLSINC